MPNNIRCNYGKPKYAIGDRVLHNGKTHVVIGFEINFDSFKWQYELLPYDERSPQCFRNYSFPVSGIGNQSDKKQ